MNPIFISYRREDSADVTGRISDHLRMKFGQAFVFIDVDNIPFGLDFRDHLEAQVSQCDVLLAVIGPHWLTAATAEGSPRLDDPADFVRIEIECALRRGIPVVPLFVQGAGIPPQGELPESMRELSFRNGIPIRRDPDFKNDMARLTTWLEEHTGGPQRQATVKRSAGGPSEIASQADGDPETQIATYLWTLVGLMLIGVALCGVWAVANPDDLHKQKYLLALGVPLAIGAALNCFRLAFRAPDPRCAATKVFLAANAGVLACLVIGPVVAYRGATVCYLIASSVSSAFLVAHIALLLILRRAPSSVFPAAGLLAITQALVFGGHAVYRIIYECAELDCKCPINNEAFLYLLYFATHAVGLAVAVAFLVVISRLSAR